MSEKPAPKMYDRREALKKVILELHNGATVEDVKERFNEVVKSATHDEIARMEQDLMEEGVPVEEVKRLCDAHAAVFRENLEAAEKEKAPPGHPVDTMRRDNRAIVETVEKLRDMLTRAAAGDGDALKEASAELERLRKVEKHYIVKENVLFPYLEKHGIYGPSKVMWAIHDDIRRGLKSLASDLEEGRATVPGELLDSIVSMVEKEENILIPNLQSVLDEEDWGSVHRQITDIGFALVDADAGWTPSPAPAAGATSGSGPGVLPLNTGALTPKQLDLILRHLPFDITFVDGEDRVRYYSEGDRIFPRSPAIIGRKVQNCHPPASVDTVNRIVSEFRAGTKDSAEFWLRLGERFVHIRYYAVRDDEGAYQGVLEVSQDIAPLQRIEGERRLLDWDSEADPDGTAKGE